MKKPRVVVTGSEGLIGASVAKHLARTHKVYRLSRRFGHDLTDPGFVRDWFSKNKAEYLVNCFGMSDPVVATAKRQTVFNAKLEDIEAFLQVNVVALFSVCREFARSRTAKAIVNLSSIYGQVSPLPGLYAGGEKHVGYSISKGAVEQMTRHLAAHLAPRVRVNCIAPGGVRSAQGNSFIKRYARRTPMGRMMRRDEINGLAAYLCSEQSSYMTGAILTVDGGWTTV